MLSLDKRYDVVVIDEIQMIADSRRGSAWTAAVLGTATEELHLCGEERAVPIVQALAEITGDELIINHYQRLTPLEVAPQSLECDLTRIRKGDCVVTFSRSNIFRLTKIIEEKTGNRCAVIYGRLPPEIRAEQAALFNDPNSGVDVLVASDAIGMGLNL
jgi:ATP-dependent RNA helicase SUPV3L1/SUV3